MGLRIGELGSGWSGGGLVGAWGVGQRVGVCARVLLAAFGERSDWSEVREDVIGAGERVGRSGCRWV